MLEGGVSYNFTITFKNIPYKVYASNLDIFTNIYNSTCICPVNALYNTADLKCGGPTFGTASVSFSEVYLSSLDALPNLNLTMTLDSFEVAFAGATNAISWSSNPPAFSTFLTS